MSFIAPPRGARNGSAVAGASAEIDRRPASSLLCGKRTCGAHRGMTNRRRVVDVRNAATVTTLTLRLHFRNRAMPPVGEAFRPPVSR
jgi:hypothetical protein